MRALIAPTPLARFTAQPSGQYYQADSFCIVNAEDADAPSLVFQGCTELGAGPLLASRVWDGLRLQGHAVSDAAPDDQFVLTWDEESQTWGPQAIPAVTATAFGHAVIVGAAAGNLTAPGITTADAIDSVIQYVGAGTAVTDIVDLTAEFTITADDTINNAAGTDTTDSKLVVNWHGPAS